ncbi:outer membrane receptor protein involved in Fe transport [Povalibacter uvarum]|uniref:Outer membrane receptor protein involved in Fe transport n=1 Tax=Povalibacter uvarum TaxID=732238 RepID=A0A841HLI5_9GAMM|nr:TonB-dependent receptor [Povalibacter uvarum]MBB6093736.1 outer membrane receptor protein involved in Fe transport [Povalibacter uvarum]
MMKHSKQLLVLTAVAVAQPALTLAQEVTLEEIIVTAQKREQRLIEVPVAITAISGSELQQRGLSSVQDISFAVPGLTMREDGPGSYTIFMRGLSNQYGSDALVGVYLDEAPLSLTGFDQLDSRVMDLERVEVLKGPQGTLYGQGSVAGAIRYITKKPVLDAFEGSIEASETFIDDGDTKETFTGVINIPIVKDKFALRLAGTIENGGGWQDQPQAGIEDGNNQDLKNFRAKALWKITDKFSADAMIVIHRNESELGLGFENPDRTITVAVDRSRVLIPKKFEYNLYNLNLTYDFGGAELLSASTYIDHHHEYPFSYIGGPESFYQGALEGTDARYSLANQFSQELRLASTGEGPLTWTLGAFYKKLNNQLEAYYDTLYAGVYFPPAYYLSKDGNESYALFADLAWAITDRIEVGAGVRYFEDDQDTFDGTESESDSFNSTDPRVYASFKLAENMNLYASAAKGFRSGGFNRGDLPNYQPESLWSYELGLKGLVADGLLSFELAAYYSDYSDMLRRGLVLVPDAEPQFQQLTSNVGAVEVKGMEAGVTWRATDNLTLNATAAYNDSEITEVNALDATNLPGDRVDYVPELAYTLGAHFSFEMGSLPSYFRVDYSYRDAMSYIDRTSFPAENVPQWSDDIGLLDARLGVTWNAAWFELYGMNLSNQNKWIDPYHDWTNANRTRPRAIGIKVGYNFN